MFSRIYYLYGSQPRQVQYIVTNEGLSPRRLTAAADPRSRDTSCWSILFVGDTPADSIVRHKDVMGTGCQGIITLHY